MLRMFAGNVLGKELVENEGKFGIRIDNHKKVYLGMVSLAIVIMIFRT